ncbi:glycosyltransferase, partial [Mesorhizobium japonicum]|uniref:glycosyltransferase n=1 Tax=Mesorhizobium japonicum TaxID=2066070 RepID=UPI003B599596
MTPHVVARLVLPPEERPERLPLYVDGAAEVVGRGAVRVAAGTTISFGTYFNAFPAWHWRAFTMAREVTLEVRLRGRGTVIVWQSDADGTATEVARRVVDGELDAEIGVDLEPNAGGGWIWFDLEAGPEPIELVGGSWSVTAEAREQRLATLSMTTMDTPDYALGVLRALAGNPAALAALDEVVVVDQGRRKVADHPDFAATRDALGDRLRIIDQDNVGGSGGFARGMLEVAEAARSGAVILLDDDVEVEPESVARAVAFSAFTTVATIVGGHFFDLNRPLRLHAFSEEVRLDEFEWSPVGPEGEDLGAHPLRTTPWLHAPAHPDYNGWWFCLIPTEVIERIGLPIPAFLKWDDAEFGLRAQSAGIATVSLPGMAIWHVSWLDKNDSLGWQSFYHARNRLVAALVDARAPGRRLPAVNFALDLRFLLSMDYHVVELRHLAYESVLAGPESLHPELRSRLAAVLEVMRGYPSGVPVPLDEAAPETASRLPPLGGWRLGVTAARLLVRQWFSSARGVPEQPELRLAYA